MPHTLKHRRLGLTGNCHLDLSADPERPSRYLVRFCGLDRDQAARAATEHVRVKQMMACMRGRAPHPYPLPPRMIIGWIDRDGWHCGRGAYAQALAQMPKVRTGIDSLLEDLMLRVALVAAAGPTVGDGPGNE